MTKVSFVTKLIVDRRDLLKLVGYPTVPNLINSLVYSSPQVFESIKASLQGLEWNETTARYHFLMEI